MSLTDIDLRLQYRSDRDNLVKDFYVPCMNESIVYDMAVGYFTNNSLVQATKGIERFLEHDGKIRMIASPKLSEEDIIAIQAGVCAKADVIESVLIKEMEPNEYNIKNSAFNILAWLIYTNKLEIKIALMKESDVGIYHEKFGIFKDKDGSRIAFTGSTNEL